MQKYLGPNVRTQYPGIHFTSGHLELSIRASRICPVRNFGESTTMEQRNMSLQVCFCRCLSATLFLLPEETKKQWRPLLSLKGGLLCHYFYPGVSAKASFLLVVCVDRIKMSAKKPKTVRWVNLHTKTIGNMFDKKIADPFRHGGHQIIHQQIRFGEYHCQTLQLVADMFEICLNVHGVSRLWLALPDVHFGLPDVHFEYNVQHARLFNLS